MRVVGDFTTNHTGDAHEWFVAARGSENLARAGLLLLDDARSDYVGWLGVPSLPKLNYDSAALRHRVFEDDRTERSGGG